MDGSASATIDVYNPSTNQWSTMTMPHAHDHFCAVAIGSLAAFAGGTDGSHLTNVVDIYDTSTGQWSLDTLSQARESLAAAVIGNTAIFAGGAASSGYSNVVDIFTVPEPASAVGCASFGFVVLWQRNRRRRVI